MARRSKHLLPQPRYHKSGHARVNIAGQTYWLGRFGSPEAIAKYERLIGEWLASGKTRPPSQGCSDSATRSVAAKPVLPAAQDSEENGSEVATPTPEAACSASLTEVGSASSARPLTTAAVDGITVGELCTRWLEWIERNCCPNGKNKTSLYHGARQVAVALEDFWEHPAETFGSKCLLLVQEKLARTPVVSRPSKPGKSPKIRPRTRTTCNDTINRVRQLFRWAALRELVGDDRVNVLKLVPPLKATQTGIPNGRKVRPVSNELVEATLPLLPPVVADLIRFARLVGCRPGEARLLRPCEIDQRDLAKFEGIWVWKPTTHKNQWREDAPERVIAIGPKAQEILKPWLDRLKTKPERYVFSPKASERMPSGGRDRKGAKGRKPVPIPRRLVNDCYSKDSLNKAIERACLRGGLQKWTANQLRHARLTEVREFLSLDAAQAVGGHASLNMTEHYAEVALRLAIEAAKSA